GISGPDMMQAFQKQAERFDTHVRGVDVVSCDFSSRPFGLTTSEGDVVQADSVIIATGATANWIGLENELRLATSGGGVSACAVCDGALPMFRDKPLGVVGGGDSAMEEASYLAKFASKVYVIHRRDALRASQAMQDRVLSNDKIEMVWNSTVVDVLGDKAIEAVELENTQTGEQSRLDLTGLFIAIGHTPATQFLDGSGITLDDAGYVVLEGASCRTNIGGVFAAGDVADATYRQAVTAAGMGCRAALDAERWLSEQE
ncbi:MAG: FAD-dependent oxidoreductase, partial [Phycisphaerales bacterium]|nr:FAD-dependent oxidoreductase [Phycisphaerales bacterium]